jgi:trehalose 6-phosphate synthase
VRADRTEPSKNIVRGFQAFGQLLNRRRDLSGNVRFVACLYPSREAVPEYRRYTEIIKEVVDGVNHRHPGSIELFMKDDYDRTLGALLVYDVLLVNPIMDGMNLVSKEGPAVNETGGVLVLARGAGSFQELGDDSVQIDDPFDVEATADALERGLDMAEDQRRRRAASLRSAVDATSPQSWIDAQINDLEKVRGGEKPDTPPCD